MSKFFVLAASCFAFSLFAQEAPAEVTATEEVTTTEEVAEATPPAAEKCGCRR